MISAPRSWAGVTPAWLTQALSLRCPGAVVAKVSLDEVEDGTNSRARIAVTYEAGSGPPSVFVKREGRIVHRLALLALGAVATEARLASSGVDLPLEHPRPYAAGVDASRLAAIVVMDDVANASGRPNGATKALSVEEVRDGLAGLASLHAAFWGRPLPEGLQFLRPWKLGRIWAPVSAASLARGLRRLKDVATDVRAPAGVDARRLERQFRASASLALTGPQTVLHGDPHPGNTYALPGGRTGFYDWQLVRTGNWSHDVGYFLAGSLSVSDRRRFERELLDGYLDSLSSLGVAAPGADDAWDQYRATPAFGLGTWMHTFSAGSFQPEDVCLATIERFATAYADLDTGHSAVSGN